jgi:hypothetical protein
VVGPNSGYSLSFCAPELLSLHYLTVPASGSQFRSRDVLPSSLPALIAGEGDVIGANVPRQRVPEPPGFAIAYVDGYSKLKTTIDDAPAAIGARVLVRIGETSATAIVSDGGFAVAEGELALAPGSSGWRSHAGHWRIFYELFLRGGSAAQRFGSPARARRPASNGSPARWTDEVTADGQARAGSASSPSDGGAGGSRSGVWLGGFGRRRPRFRPGRDWERRLAREYSWSMTRYRPVDARHAQGAGFKPASGGARTGCGKAP